MGLFESIVSALGLKKAGLAIAGAIGGAISGAVLPGPLAALDTWVKRASAGALIAAPGGWYGAAPIAALLDRPDDAQGIAFLIGLAGLSVAFKLITTWNEFDLGGLVTRILNARNGGNS